MGSRDKNVNLSRGAYSVFLFGYTLYSFVYVCRYNFTVSAPLFQSAGLITLSEYGKILSAFSVVYAVGRLVNGILGDRLPAKYLLSVGIGLTGLSNFLFVLFPSFFPMLVFWSVNGFAQSMIWGPLLVAVTSRFCEEKRGSVGAMLVTAVGTGSVIGVLIAAFLSEISLKLVFIIPAAISIALGAAAFFVFGKSEPTRKAPSKSVLKNINRGELANMLCMSAIYGIVKDNSAYFAPAFFISAYAVNIKEMSFFVLIIPVLTLAGRLLFPFVYRISGNNEFKTSAYAYFAATVCALLLMIPGAPIAVTAAALSVISAACSVIGTALLSSYPMRYSAEGNVSSVSGLADFAAYAGAGLGSSVFAAVISRFGYSPVFCAFAVLSVVGALLSYMLKKRFEH